MLEPQFANEDGARWSRGLSDCLGEDLMPLFEPIARQRVCTCACVISLHTMASFNFDEKLVDPVLAEFIAAFYAYADRKETIEKWAACFAEDVVMIRAGGNVVGPKSKPSNSSHPRTRSCLLMTPEELSELNESTWENLSSRKHNILKGFALSSNPSDEVMLHGYNEYVYTDKSTGRRDWASRIKFRQTGNGEIQITEYQSYLVSFFPSTLSYKIELMLKFAESDCEALII